MIAILLLTTLWDHSFNCDIQFTYDSNIFAYSAEYIEDFMNKIRAYRFPFETYDDAFTDMNFDMKIRNKLVANHTTTFNCGFQVRHYAINHQKDFQRITAGLRQSFGSWAIKGAYRVTPGYLIRYYRDPTGMYNEYRACEVTYHAITSKITLPWFKYLEPALVYDYSIDDYAEVFDIYDAHGHTIGMQTNITLSKIFLAEFSYALKTSILDTVACIDPEDDELLPDGTYLQQTVGADLQISGIASLPLCMGIGYDYSFRNYRSDHPGDRMHFGRQDHQHRITLESKIKVRTGMLFTVGYAHALRRATSEIFPDINTIKNYDQNRLSAGLEFYY
jgi:hypothetical protein